MFRILIVEDMDVVLQMLKERVAEDLPEALVEVALNVQDARESVERACESGKLYDAVVLDFKLPESAGENAELDESLCEDVGLLMPDAVVAHLSAFMEDGKVLEHMKRAHDQNVDRSLRFSKLDVTWPEQLVGKLRTFLYGARVESKLNKFVPRGDALASSGSKRDRLGEIGGSLTHELASLQREIAAHWSDYDDKLKARIERNFDITLHGDRMIVTVR
ncbi:MAG: response regulator [Acidobacteria bacterium]|nr:response regulator [Acidobacteriota bacterium]